jgi:predicted ATPase
MRTETVGNLPQELTSFVGRRHDLAQVRSLLAESRLVTLVGVGGVGKTRLALRVGAGMRRRFDAGVWFVELDQVRDEDLVAHAVARALGLCEQPGQEPAAVLREYLAQRRLLLVLDNCEHLIGAVAELVRMLLLSTSGVRILATSRESLRLDGERTHVVAPLAVPDLKRGTQQLSRYEAVALFSERARAAVPSFRLSPAHRVAVGEICFRLDGLPLAIELAAARLRLLTPEQLRDRLADRALLTEGRRSAPTRQQTLRACIEWSYDLCTGAEQLLWARLSVFAGDFDLEAAEGVCDNDGTPAGEVLDLIASLVDKSILLTLQELAGVLRYRMLQSIRTYGRERLAAIGEEAMLRRRHRDWHQLLLARFHAEWIGPRQLDWLRRLDWTAADISAALEFSLSVSDVDTALAMSGDLYVYWGVSGLHHQARYWMNRVLAPAGPSSPARLAALVCEATLAGASGDVAAERVRVRQIWEVAEHLGDAHSHALAITAEGRLTTTAGGDLPGAVRLYTDALRVFRAEADIHWQVIALTNLTFAGVLLDDMAGAAAAHQEMLAICESRGESVMSGFTGMALGIGLWRQGDLNAAATQTTRCLKLLHRSGGVLATHWCLEVTAWIAASREEPERAATLLGAATALADTMGTRAPNWPDLLTYHEQCQQQVRQVLGAQAFAAAFERGHTLHLNDATAYAVGG